MNAYRTPPPLVESPAARPLGLDLVLLILRFWLAWRKVPRCHCCNVPCVAHPFPADGIYVADQCARRIALVFESTLTRGAS